VPDEIDPDTAPRRARTLYTVELDGEAVLLDEASNRLHHLNRTATVLWSCFDGETTIGDLVSDISDELGLPRARVLADTLAVVRNLCAEGLLDASHTRTTRWRRHPAVLWRRSLDAVVFMAVGAEESRTLAGTGPLVWDLLAEERSAAELASALAPMFDADIPQIEADVRSTLAALAQLGAIERVEPRDAAD
jgi:Coenzyme PQQ synthesis protein D (PqqD)